MLWRILRLVTCEVNDETLRHFRNYVGEVENLKPVQVFVAQNVANMAYDRPASYLKVIALARTVVRVDSNRCKTFTAQVAKPEEVRFCFVSLFNLKRYGIELN